MANKYKNEIVYFFLVTFFTVIYGAEGDIPLDEFYSKLKFVLPVDNLLRGLIFMFLVFIILSLIHMLYGYDSGENTKSHEFLSGIKDGFISELKRIGFTRFRPKPGWFIVVSIVSATMIYYIWSLLISGVKINIYHLFILFLFLSPGALAEEVLFRYAIFKELMEYRVNLFLAYILPAVLFGFMHFYQNVNDSPEVSALVTFFSALIYQYLYESSEWSIYPSWFLHSFHNAIIVFTLHKM